MPQLGFFFFNDKGNQQSLPFETSNMEIPTPNHWATPKGNASTMLLFMTFHQILGKEQKITELNHRETQPLV